MLCYFTFRANWVQVNTLLYKKGAAVVYSVQDMPRFGEIVSVYIANKANIVLHIKELETLSFIEHYSAYSVCSPRTVNRTSLLRLHTLPLRQPMHIQNMKLVVLPYHIHLTD